MRFRWVLPAAALTVFCAEGCGSGCGGHGGGGSNGRDASVDAGDGLPDAGDGGPTSCIVELPATGRLIGVSNWGNIVAYGQDLGDPTAYFDVYYYNLVEMVEHNVTNRPKGQADAFVRADEIVFMDDQFYDAQAGNLQTELFLFNVATGIESRLTDSPYMKYNPKLNQHDVLYLCNEGCGSPDTFNLSLMNRNTGQVTVVSGCDQDPETPSISENFAAWTARPYQGHNKDIYVRDLAAGVTFRIDSTDEGEQYFPHTDDDHVIWEDERDGRREIYMYTMSTGEEVCLTPDEWEQAWPFLRTGIASWCDYRFSQQIGMYAPCDVYVYDLATGAGRRVTTESDTWGPGFVDSGRILYARAREDSRATLYVHDLVCEGIMTPDGHVVP